MERLCQTAYGSQVKISKRSDRLKDIVFPKFISSQYSIGVLFRHNCPA